VGHLDDPSAGLEVRVVSLLLNLFTALHYMRSIVSIFDSLLSRISCVSFVGAQMLVGDGAFNYNSIEDPG
jgi:hypothetical protein